MNNSIREKSARIISLTKQYLVSNDISLKNEIRNLLMKENIVVRNLLIKDILRVCKDLDKKR